MATTNFIKNNNFTFKFLNSRPIDDQSVESNNHYRIFRDQVTSAYTSIFLNDNTMRALFLDYTYSIIYFSIQCKINKELLSNNFKPLDGTEGIYLMFKGGNVMNHYYSAYFNQLNQHGNNLFVKCASDSNINNFNDNTTFGNFLNGIRRNFMISDVDYSVYIKTEHNHRFIILREIVTRILSHALETITNFFNTYINNVILNRQQHVNNNTPNTTDRFNGIFGFDPDDTCNSHSFNYQLREILNNQDFINEIKNPNLNIQACTFDTKTILIKIIHVIELIQNDFNLQGGNIQRNSKIFKNAYIIQNLYTIKYLNTLSGDKILTVNIDKNGNVQNVGNIFNVDNLIQTYQNYVDLLILKKQDDIIDFDFYTNQKIDNFKDQIVINIDQLCRDELIRLNRQPNPNLAQGIIPITITKYDVKYDLNDEKTIIEYRLEENNVNIRNNYDLSPNHEDTIIYCSPKFNEQQKIHSIQKNNNYHYITYNNIIYVEKRTHVVDFDLMRVKLNIVGKNMYTRNGVNYDMLLPTEFIDVSIPSFMALKHDHIFESFENNPQKIPYVSFNIYQPNTQILIKNVMINAYDINILVDDLSFVLFDQNVQYIPWLDNKYNKRIERLLFLKGLSFIDRIHTEPQCINLYKDFINLADKIFNNVQNQVWYNPLSLKLNTAIDNTIKLFTKFIEVKDNEQNLRFILSLVVNKREINMMNFIVVKPEYTEYKNFILCLLLWTLFYDIPSDTLLAIINKMRLDRGYVQINNNTHVAHKQYCIEKFKELLRTCINTGTKTLCMINLITNNTLGIRYGGKLLTSGNIPYDETKYFNKYRKYKLKYINEFNLKYINESKF
jgi:hypothetical protein